MKWFLGEVAYFIGSNYITLIFVVLTIIHNISGKRNRNNVLLNVAVDAGLPFIISLASTVGLLTGMKSGTFEIESFYPVFGSLVFGIISFIYHSRRKHTLNNKEQEKLIEFPEEESTGEINQAALEKYLANKHKSG